MTSRLPYPFNHKCLNIGNVVEDWRRMDILASVCNHFNHECLNKENVVEDWRRMDIFASVVDHFNHECLKYWKCSGGLKKNGYPCIWNLYITTLFINV